jgi:hypothetical protein
MVGDETSTPAYQSYKSGQLRAGLLCLSGSARPANSGVDHSIADKHTGLFCAQTPDIQCIPLQLPAVPVSPLHFSCQLVLQADCCPFQLLDYGVSSLQLLRKLPR